MQERDVEKYFQDRHTALRINRKTYELIREFFENSNDSTGIFELRVKVREVPTGE